MVKHMPGDPRFQDKEWTENAFFDFLRQAYLMTGRWAEDMIENASTVDQHTKHRAQFYLNQIVSALSPSNFPFTNPEVIRTTFSTGGHNLAKGLSQLWRICTSLANSFASARPICRPSRLAGTWRSRRARSFIKTA